MDRFANGLPELPIETRLKRDGMFAVLWVVVMGLTVHEYVPNTVTYLTFAVAGVLGGSFAIGVTYWLRRTERGRAVGAAYRNSAFIRRLLVALVVAIAGVGAGFALLAVIGVSSVLAQSAFLGGLFAYRFTDTALLYARSRNGSRRNPIEHETDSYRE
ncbi:MULTISPECIES: hypothetical protein [Halococcus]|uniref:Uncharacterized protein n=1 Tax=Halococcus salifodinae DSM 8989 TaxID=1227456 RepID=M0N692_9EURY|nr:MULTISPECIES: hypothetical protein [Halococcus]EMA52639.1 hypothetical protein C450_11088 [Halococcus salifodinae DSM 8989]